MCSGLTLASPAVVWEWSMEIPDVPCTWSRSDTSVRLPTPTSPSVCWRWRHDRGLGRAHRPDAVAVERVFAQHNVRTVMGTAQASGVAILAAARRGIPVVLHTPSEVKAAVTGSGRADKAQVTAMVTRLLRLDRGAQARRCRGRAGPGDLPRLARRRPGRSRSPLRSRGSREVGMIAYVAGRVAALGA